MSTTMQALTILLERAEAERDEALAQMLDLRRQAEQARAQAEQLGQYRSEYQQRWSQQFARQGTVDILACYQTFGLRLDQAIDQQGLVANHADGRLERAMHKLKELELRVASVKKLLERRQQEHKRAAWRQEQKLTDEQAARASLAQYNTAFARLSA